MTHISIPSEAVKYILFQRTQYLLVHRNPTARKLIASLPKAIGFPLESLLTSYNGAVAVEGALTRRAVEDLFSKEMSDEYEQMKAYLPRHAKKILDIGCGVGGIDVLLGKHFQDDAPEFYLIDRTEMPGKVYYSYRPQGCYYNSLAISKKLLANNGIAEEKVFAHEANDKGIIEFKERFDLIVSLISWGFHYPVQTYIEEAYAKLAPGGVLILDVRRGQGGIELLRQKFGNAEAIFSAGKHDRVVCRKQA